MNGSINTNLEVVPTDTPQYYTVLCLRARSPDENGSRVGERFGVRYAGVDSHVKFGWLSSNLFVKSCDARLM